MARIRWNSFWSRVGAKGDRDGVYRDLADRYAEPHRAYHTMAHIERCLEAFDPARHLAVDQAAVEAALWFHDAQYVPGDPDNEAVSAGYAERTLILDMRLDPKFAANVAELIRATAHSVVPEDNDARIVTDVDLVILGATKAEFDAYDAGIRQEYAHVPDQEYAGGRRAVLLFFLSRPRIYATKYFERRFSGQARYNLRRVLDRLENDDP